MKNNSGLISSAASSRYTSLDGLRAISCICIMLMHILANTNYELSGVVYDKMIQPCKIFCVNG